MTRPHISAILAAFLSSNLPVGNSIGIVSHAERAHVGAGSASTGATLYEGDRLTTDAGGELAVRNTSLALQLEQQTDVTLGSPAPGERGIAVDIASGTLIFSTDGDAAVSVNADGAIIRAADDAATIAHVRVVNPQELRIFAQRGGLEFAYRNEQEMITEGTCYRVLLNREEESPDGPQSAGVHGAKTSSAHKSFVFIAIAAGAAAGAAVERSHHPHPHPHESPDRP
jgi:hypothetical protein